MSFVRFDLSLIKNRENYLKLVQHLKQAMSHEALLQVDPYAEKENFKQFQKRVAIARDEMLGWFNPMQRTIYNLTPEEENEAVAMAERIEVVKTRLSEPKLFFIDKLTVNKNPGYYLAYERHDDVFTHYNQFKLVQCYPVLSGNDIPVQNGKKKNPKAIELVGRLNLSVIMALLRLIDRQEKSLIVPGKFDSSILKNPIYQKSIFNDPELVSFHVELFQGFFDYINGLSAQFHRLSNHEAALSQTEITEIKRSLEEIKARKVFLFKKLGLNCSGLMPHKAELVEGFEEGDVLVKDCNELIAKIESSLPEKKEMLNPGNDESLESDYVSCDSDDEFFSCKESTSADKEPVKNEASNAVIASPANSSSATMIYQLSKSESSPVVEPIKKSEAVLEEIVMPSSPVRSRSNSGVLDELYIKKDEPHSVFIDLMREHRNKFIIGAIAFAATATVVVVGIFFAPALLALPFVAKTSFSIFATTGLMVSGEVIVGGLIAGASVVAGAVGAGLARAVIATFGKKPEPDQQPPSAEQSPSSSARIMDVEPTPEQAGRLVPYVTEPSKALRRSRRDLSPTDPDSTKDSVIKSVTLIGGW